MTASTTTKLMAADDLQKQQQQPNPNPTSFPNPPPPLKVLFLSSDTGGGHRASAESLARQFEILHPGSTYTLLDALTDCTGPSTFTNLLPSNCTFTIESAYKHLSAHPHQWKLVYDVTNTRTVRSISTVGLNLTTEQHVRRRIQLLGPDVVVSVHPMMNAVPSQSCARISAETGRHLPMFTVVTDLGSGHDTWFAGKRNVENIFLASDALVKLATDRKRGGNRVPRDKIVRSGLPIRHDFAVQARLLGEGEEDGGRTSQKGREYRRLVRERLGLVRPSQPQQSQQQQPQDGLTDQTAQQLHNLQQQRQQQEWVMLVMGGGEGIGSLSSIVDSLYVELASRSINATIVVVCGRNVTLRKSLETKDWTELSERGRVMAERRRKTRELARTVRRMMSRSGSAVSCPSDEEEEDDDEKKGAMQEMERRRGGGGSPTPGAVPCVSSYSSLSSIEGGDHDDDDEKGGADDEQSVPAASAAAAAAVSPLNPPPRVRVRPLGFVTRMAEYMVASDVLITKAGPGTIAEAASVGLPVLLTSYLPGQEEGNVDFVLQNEFGAYVPDSDPEGVARECAAWLRSGPGEAGGEGGVLDTMSMRATEAGVPHAAEDIARFIGRSVVRWKELNEEHAASAAAADDDVSTGTERVEGRKDRVVEVKVTTKESRVVVCTNGNNLTTPGPLESPISIAAL